jgi:BON domain
MDDTDQPIDRPGRLPYPSEDTGDLAETPASGLTDDPLVAREEGVPYEPPEERVLTDTRLEQSGPDQAGVAPTLDEELGREEGVDDRPTDDALAVLCLEALRRSELPAGDRIRIAVAGHTVHVRGTVESVDILDEILNLVGEVPGVDDVVDEVIVIGV